MLVSRVLAIAVLVCLASPGFSQENEPIFPRTPAEMIRGNAQFHLVLGRILLDERHYKVGQHHRTEKPSPGNKNSNAEFSLNVVVESGGPSLVLHARSLDEKWTVEARSVGKLRIEYETTSSDPLKVVIDQPEHGPVVCSLAHKGEKVDATALSLWHLWFTGDDRFKKHLFPLLEKIDSAWNFPSIATDTLKRLEQELQGVPVVSQEQIRKLTIQFADGDSSRRDQANRELRGYGLIVLPTLMRMDLSSTEPEQRLRIERLIRSMQPQSEDNSIRVSEWLSGDAKLCQSLLAEHKIATSDSAKVYLKALSGNSTTIRR